MVPLAVIDADVAELIRYGNELYNILPPLIRDIANVSCQMFLECCSIPRSQLIIFIASNNEYEVSKKCFGNSFSETFVNKTRACKPFQWLLSIINEPAVKKLLSIDKSLLKFSKEYALSISKACSPDDIISFTCDWVKNNKYRTCERRHLYYLAKSTTAKKYKKKVAYLKTKSKELVMAFNKTFAETTTISN